MSAVIVLGTIVLFFVVLIREHRLANKWRKLMRQYADHEEQNKTNPVVKDQWEVTYREGRKTHMVTVSAPTEAQAMKEAMKLPNVRFDKIASLVRK